MPREPCNLGQRAAVAQFYLESPALFSCCPCFSEELHAHFDFKHSPHQVEHIIPRLALAGLGLRTGAGPLSMRKER